MFVFVFVFASDSWARIALEMYITVFICLGVFFELLGVHLMRALFLIQALHGHSLESAPMPTDRGKTVGPLSNLDQRGPLEKLGDEYMFYKPATLL